MADRNISIRFDGSNEKPYRIYWSRTQELASARRFATVEEAGSLARAFMEVWHVECERGRSNH